MLHIEMHVTHYSRVPRVGLNAPSKNSMYLTELKPNFTGLGRLDLVFVMLSCGHGIFFKTKEVSDSEKGYLIWKLSESFKYISYCVSFNDQIWMLGGSRFTFSNFHPLFCSLHFVANLTPSLACHTKRNFFQIWFWLLIEQCFTWTTFWYSFAITLYCSRCFKYPITGFFSPKPVSGFQFLNLLLFTNNPGSTWTPTCSNGEVGLPLTWTY